MDAQLHFARGLVLSERLQDCSAELFISRVGVDSRITCCITSANALWLLGYPDQALKRVDEALRASRHLSHPSTHSIVLLWAQPVYQWRGDVFIAQEKAQELIHLSREQNYGLIEVTASLYYYYALAMERQDREHIPQIRQCITAMQARGAKVDKSVNLLRLASVYKAVGQIEEGFVLLDEATSHIEQTDERFCEAELHRLKGEFLLQQSSDNHTEAEACFHQAITIAQNQQAKSWELRAATSLARLYQQQGKRDEARELLGDVYGWFTEGFDTADLIDAKALLDELA